MASLIESVQCDGRYGTPPRGSSGSDGTIRHRWQNVNEPESRFIDEITCPGEMRSPFPRIAPALALHCARKTMPTCYRFRSIPVSSPGYEIPDQLAFLRNEVTASWMLAYRSMRKRERKRKKNVYRLTDFFSSRNGKAKNRKEIGIREPCNKRLRKDWDWSQRERN